MGYHDIRKKWNSIMNEDQVWVEIPLKDDENYYVITSIVSLSGNMGETARSIKEIENILIQA